MKPQSAKAKGRKLQQWTRDSIIKWFPTLTDQDVRSTSMGAGGVDVTLSAEAFRQFPYKIECKNRKTMAIYNDYEQAEAHASIGRALLIIKANGKRPLAVMDAEDFFMLAWQNYEMMEKEDNEC